MRSERICIDLVDNGLIIQWYKDAICRQTRVHTDPERALADVTQMLGEMAQTLAPPPEDPHEFEEAAPCSR
jgi:hypothetical protein